MEMQNTSSCAIQEIVNLKHGKDAKSNMFSFCQQNLLPGICKFFSARNGDLAPLTAHGENIFCFYLFTANVEYATYGQDFAKFITDHKLGKLITTEALPNVAYHGGGKCQAWIWTPDAKALRAWYEAEKAARKAAKKSVAA